MEIIITVLTGALVTALVELSKRTKIAAEFLLVAFCIIAGALYTAYDFYIAVDAKEAVLQFMTGTFTASVVLYEFVYKKFKKRG